MPYDAQAPAKGPAKFTISNVDSRPDANAVQKIVNAITALNLGKGITYEPFTLLCTAGAFNNLWNTDSGTPITFYQSNGAKGSFLPLGDLAVIGQSLDAGTPPPGTQILFAPSSDPSVLAHPVSFTWILDDHGSGNDRDIDYFTMNPPDGYVALGIAFNGSGDAPDANNYWCVRSDLVRAVGANGVWSDSGQGWSSHDGSLSAPVAGLLVPEPAMLFAPPTLLSNEGGNPAYALLMQQADLQVQMLEPGMPVYDTTITNGDETAYGLSGVKILPYTAVPDPGFLNQSAVSPFYFVAAEPYYLCTKVLPTAGGGSFQVTQTVGTSQSDSSNFTTDTSMTVSADVGVAYGPASLKVSASYTESFGTSVTHTTTHDTQVQTQITVNLPPQPRTWIWERQTQIAVFRTDTSQLVPVTYSEPNIIFIPS